MNEAFDSLYHQNWIEGQYLQEPFGTRGSNGVHQGARGGLVGALFWKRLRTSKKLCQ